MACPEEKSYDDNSPRLNTSSVLSTHVMSPVTDLTLNLSSLSTGNVSTPRKRLSWSNATPSRMNVSQEIEGCENEPKNDLLASKEKLFQHIIGNGKLPIHKLSGKMCNSSLATIYFRGKENIPALDCQPNRKKIKGKITYDGSDTDSQDCGYSESLSDQDFSLHNGHNIVSNTALCTSDLDDTDDGFLEVFQMDRLDDEDKSWEMHLPTNITGLLTKPLCNAKIENHATLSNIKSSKERNEKLPIRRCLSMHTCRREVLAELSPALEQYCSGSSSLNNEDYFTSSNTVCLSNATHSAVDIASCNKIQDSFTKVVNNNKNKFIELHQEQSVIQSAEQKVAFKRPDPPKDITSPIQSKRRKSVPFLSHASESQILIKKKISLQRCYSESEVIMRALQKSYQEPDLIGDFSKPYALPLVKGRHEDLKCISPETVVQLLTGNYSNTIAGYTIVDCRYPYEFDAGHIIGAKNIYTEEEILRELLINQNAKFKVNCKRHIVIFHCEYSSERAPKLCRFLRNKDRETNIYPSLNHPEIYILNGGYKAFFETFKEYCEPQDYKPMIHKDHENDLRHFRSKSKSWSSDSKSRVSVRPGLQF